MSTSNSTRLRAVSGCSSSFSSLSAPRRPSSCRVIARMRLIRTNDVSAIARTADAMSRTMTPARISQSLSDTSLTSLELPEAGHELPLPALHRGRLVVVLMVEAEEVEDAVHDQEAELVVDRHVVVDRLPLGHLGA